MPLNTEKLNQTNGATSPQLRRPNPPNQAGEEPTPQPTPRTIGQVRSDVALTTADSAAARIHQIENYVEDLHNAVARKVDDAAFAIAATIATVPAQLANRTQFYLEKMGGQEAWNHFDRALGEIARSPGEQLLFNSDVFELPSGDLFEDPQ
jgi:hypothetical protein